MNEYEIFKKWVNSFDEKIYYKTKPPTKKELYEIAIKQEEEIERLNNNWNKLEEEISNHIALCTDITLNDILDLIQELKGDNKE